jgi:hypothetical protein
MTKLSNSVLETVKIEKLNPFVLEKKPSHVYESSHIKKDVKKAVKKVVTRKPLTEEQKEMQAKKRALNPTFANAVSQANKKDILTMKTDFKLSLLEAKRRANLLEDVNLDAIENLVFINLCKSFINKMLRKGNEENIEIFKKLNKLNRFGTYQTNWILSNISFVVKEQIRQGLKKS